MQTHAIDLEALGRRPAAPLLDAETALSIENLNLFYGPEAQALHDIHLEIPRQRVTAFIGPSGCGKSSLLRCLNRMNDLVDGCRVEGRVMLEGDNIYATGVDVAGLRRRVGMVFQKPNPFPKSIYENVAYGPRIHGLAHSKAEMDEIVEKSLRRASLWDEVKDVLDKPGTGLSGGAIAVEGAISPDSDPLGDPQRPLRLPRRDRRSGPRLQRP